MPRRPGAHQGNVIRSTTWLSGGLAIAGDRATLAGRCVVTVLDRGGRVIEEIDGARFRVDALDGGGRRGTDGFALSVYTSTGRMYHQVGTLAEPLRLAAGRIVVQP